MTKMPEEITMLMWYGPKEIGTFSTDDIGGDRYIRADKVTPLVEVMTWFATCSDPVVADKAQQALKAWEETNETDR